jgi:hypothetical protein
MSALVGAIIGAVALICIPLIAWFSRRSTREGRLILRVERLGNVFALMPESSQKDTFKARVNSAVASLNSWLDPDNVKRRKTIRRVSFGTYALCVAVVLFSALFVNTSKTPWFTSVVGIVLGVLIAVITQGTTFFLERSARVKKEKAVLETENAATAARIEALRLGQAPN